MELTSGKASRLFESGIRRVFVDGLFGRYRYDLTEDLLLNSASRVLLFYGDNGTGKTTILRILFFLLSHVDKTGHKAQLKKIRFRTFEVDFADGTSVIASRKNDRETGYELAIYRNKVLIAKAPYFTDPETDDDLVRSNPKEFVRLHRQKEETEQSHQVVLRTLRDLDLRMIYVTDKRQIFTTISEVRNNRTHRTRYSQGSLFDSDEKNDFNTEAITISTAVEQIGSWATRQALSLSAQGEEDVNAVYAKIIEKLATAGRDRVETPSDISSVLEQLEALQQRSAEFARFGLSRVLKLESISRSLADMSDQARQTALVVLAPYLESLTARFVALDPIRFQLLQFVEILTSFYKTKTVSLRVGRGLQISMEGEPISPAMLSSGEAQLLFILASTLTAKERSGLFLVDEPEISLNVVWQRKLLKALLDITDGTNIQFIMATHSVELLTQYSEFVLNLNRSALH